MGHGGNKNFGTVIADERAIDWEAHLNKSPYISALLSATTAALLSGPPTMSERTTSYSLLLPPRSQFLLVITTRQVEWLFT